MSDTTTTTTPPPNPPPAPPPAPWHTGIEPEFVGHWQNKGWKVDDPKEIAVAATKQARELERHFGVPADQLLRLPKPDAKPEDIKAFWSKLGAPADAKEYDFSGIKRADGTLLDGPLADALRTAALNAHVPKDAAATLAAAIAKHLDDTRAADSAVRSAKIDQEKADLRKEWGVNFDFNHLKAMEGARRLGISPEAVVNMEKEIGYKATMEAMRKIGAGTSEDTFVDRGQHGSAGQVTTREGAVARKAELFADKNWTKRLNANDVQAVAEWTSLNKMIDGET